VRREVALGVVGERRASGQWLGSDLPGRHCLSAVTRSVRNLSSAHVEPLEQRGRQLHDRPAKSRWLVRSLPPI